MAGRVGQAHSSVRFDQTMALVGLWFQGGLLLDLWAHSRGLVGRTEGFFTPWHIVFYLGFAALASALVAVTLRNRRAGRSWREAVPLGYDFAAAGLPVFLLSGAADFVKHTLTGFDLAAEAPIAPSHLGVILGMALLISGPLRAAWLRPEPGRWWSDRWPAVLSLAGVFTAATLVSQFSSPLAKVWADPAVLSMFRPDLIYAPSLAISGMLIHSALMVGFFLPAIRRGILPTGSLAAVMGYNAALMTIQYSQYRLIPAAILAGLLFDLLARGLRHLDRVWLWPVTAAAIPVIFFGLYFLTLALLGRLGWPLHIWAGTLVITGAAGWGLSLVIRR